MRKVVLHETEAFDYRTQKQTPQDRALNSFNRTVEATRRKQEEWAIRVEIAEVAQKAVTDYIQSKKF